jgi:hypothetical protein
MFIDDADRDTFLWMIWRHLTVTPTFDAGGRPYRPLGDQVTVLAFALMTNHFHLVLRQLRPRGVETLMHRSMSSYVRYFNRRRGDSGAMFDGRFRAALKADRRSQLNAIAYVHDNHGLSCNCKYCSHRYYDDPEAPVPSWVSSGLGLELFGGPEQYRSYRVMRAGISELAG